MTETGPRKGLWDLMNQKRSEDASSTPPVPPPAAEEIGDETVILESSPLAPPPSPPIDRRLLQLPPAADPEPADVKPPIDRRLLQLPPAPSMPARGLWAMMQHTEEAPTADPAIENPYSVDESPSTPEAPLKKIDRRLLQRPTPEFEIADDSDQRYASNSESSEYDDESIEADVELELADAGEDEPPAHETEALPDELVGAVSGIPEPRIATIREGLSRSALWSVILGGISLPVSLVAIYPAIWSRIPPSVCGFAALGLGFVAHGEIQRSAGRVKGLVLAYAGIAMGLFGMFAGPTIYSPLDLYGQWSNSHTGMNLKQIGLATDAYFQQQQSYPAGGLFKDTRDAGEGEPEPQHGWMTLLLPHLPEGAGLSKQIDMSKPYFDPVNEPAMRQTVPTFLAIGGNTALVQRKYGPAHFAGVGGLVSLPEGRMAHAGVFDINSSVNHEDIVDGRSNTMIAGEVSINYPAWGEPHNWRQIGKGLNRDPQGFGNARHTGAIFLMADGSVKFLPNKTNPKVLQALSTRDGEETP